MAEDREDFLRLAVDLSVAFKERAAKERSENWDDDRELAACARTWDEAARMVDELLKANLNHRSTRCLNTGL